MAWKKYRLIQDGDVIDEVSMHHYERALGFDTRSQFVSVGVAFTLAVSLITNVVFIVLHFRYGPDAVSSTAFGRVPLGSCIIQIANNQQPALSAIKRLHGTTTATLPVIIEPYGIKLGTLWTLTRASWLLVMISPSLPDSTSPSVGPGIPRKGCISCKATTVYTAW